MSNYSGRTVATMKMCYSNEMVKVRGVMKYSVSFCTRALKDMGKYIRCSIKRKGPIKNCL